MASRRNVLGLVVLVVLVGFAGLVAVTRLRGPLRVPLEHQLLVYDVPAEIEEAPPPYLPFSWAALRRDQPTLLDVCDAIDRAAADGDVDALVLHVDDVAWGWSRVSEFREAVRRFREAGKPVFAQLSGGGEQALLLASAADRVSMPETAVLQLDGLSLSAMFLRGTYDKVGITPNFAHVGQYKSAVETYTRTGFSEPARTALDALLDDDFALLVDSLASARGLPGDSIRRLIDEGPFTAPGALAAGLLDTLLDEPSLDAVAEGCTGRDLRRTSLGRYADVPDGLPGDDEIALVVASGAIVPGRSHNSPFGGEQCGSETIVNALRDARKRRSVKAIVLRVDSPGGSGQASDDIWQEVRRARERKPVVVSMSNLAASGGYYIACGANAIVAEPATVTGSIGVFGGKLNLMGLYRKLGLNVETISRGRNAEMLSPFRDFTPEEQRLYQAQLDDFYRVFVSRVAEGRGLDPAMVDSLGRGRVWSGLAAQRFGLVDTLGGLRTAVAVARQRAGLGEDREARLTQYPRPRRSYLQGVIEGLLEDPSQSDDTRMLSPILSAWLAAARFPTGATLAMLPYTIDIR